VPMVGAIDGAEIDWALGLVLSGPPPGSQVRGPAGLGGSQRNREDGATIEAVEDVAPHPTAAAARIQRGVEEGRARSAERGVGAGRPPTVATGADGDARGKVGSIAGASRPGHVSGELNTSLDNGSSHGDPPARGP
jgi:hypothetical protein